MTGVSFFPDQTGYTSNACQNSSISLKKNIHGWWTRKLLANPHVCQTFISILLLRLLLYFTSFVFLFQHRRLCWQHQQNWPIRFQGRGSRDPAHRKFTGALPYPLNCRCCDLFSFEVMHSLSSSRLHTHFALLHYFILTQVSSSAQKPGMNDQSDVFWRFSPTFGCFSHRLAINCGVHLSFDLYLQSGNTL